MVGVLRNAASGSLEDWPLTRKGDHRLAGVIGRHARLELVFGCRGGRTVVTHGYAEPPLRIGRSFDADGAAYLILVCSAPGVFAGDVLHQRVTVGRGARVLLASQSALQIHPTEAATPATVHYEYCVESGGELHCHWDPVIPFAGARLTQRIDLRLAGESRFYWSDALMSGRTSRGESWAFGAVDHELRLHVEGVLRYLERYRVAPETRNPCRPWLAGDSQYLGTTMVHHEAATLDAAEALQRRLAAVAGVRAGVDLVEPRLMIARLLSAGGAPFAKARAAFREGVLDAVFGAPQLVVRR